MAAIYGNSEFMKNKRSHLMDKSANEREVTSAKRMKVLLIVLAVSLGFALGGICALSLLYLSASSLKHCEVDWTEHSGKKYYFSSKRQTWFEARNFCIELNAHLVIITRNEVQDFLASNIGVSHWIGLNDLETEGRWVWSDNQILNETEPKFWFNRKEIGEPDNWNGDSSSGEDCACLGFKDLHLNSWFDVSCEYKKNFICEKEN